MPLENLQRINELSVAFKYAVEKHYGQNPKLTEKAHTCLKPGEWDKMMGQVEEYVQESLQYAFGGTPSESFLKKNIALADITADIATRIMPKDKVVKLVPDELKKPENVEILRQIGATHLVDICTQPRKKKFGLF